MRSVDSALETILARFAPLEQESVPLHDAAGRVLAADILSQTTHPSRPVSAMDGYAVNASDLSNLPCDLESIGVSPAGGDVLEITSGQTVRIFTGGPMPRGGDAVVIQENTRQKGQIITILEAAKAGDYVRPTGLDFTKGTCLLKAGDTLSAQAIALAAAMNYSQLPVYRRPRIAIISTGDEIVRPGSPLLAHQIPGSNAAGLAAFVTLRGGIAKDLGILKDTAKNFQDWADKAQNSDLLITSGGVSVGDRDYVKSGFGQVGLKTIFWKVAMRPGKPLLFGMLGETPLLAFPGNPVSAIVCAHIFLGPVLNRLLGKSPRAQEEHNTILARLKGNLPANGTRQEYLRTRLIRDQDHWYAEPFSHQDSAMLATLNAADALLIRSPLAPPLAAGSMVRVFRLDP